MSCYCQLRHQEYTYDVVIVIIDSIVLEQWNWSGISKALRGHQHQSSSSSLQTIILASQCQVALIRAATS
eukprot:scaffold13264_cov173-Skeletonema_marinoi.AAC.3